MWQGGSCYMWQSLGGGGGLYGGGPGCDGGGAGGGSSGVAKGVTVTSNIQGDSRCSSNGLIYITPITPITISSPSKLPNPKPTTRPSAPPSAAPTPSYFAGPSVTFQYTGKKQIFIVPPLAHYIKVDACGAAGYGGSFGGFVSAVVPLAQTPGSLEEISVYVGGAGSKATPSSCSYWPCPPSGGGWNGGGGVGSHYWNYGAGGGGGASDVRIGDGGVSLKLNLVNRLVVAGGGGGGSSGSGGAGGGLIAGSGNYQQNQDVNVNGQGGSQTSGGAGRFPGVFGKGGGEPYSAHGGGGGWFGGGSSSGLYHCCPTTLFGGAGGGSSYVLPTGTVLKNVQGDTSCNGNGTITITPLTRKPTEPTARPTTAPTALTTLKPTSSFLDYPASVDSVRVESFTFTGTKQTYVVPEEVYAIQVDACGGRGKYGANGGFVSAVLFVTPGDELSVYVGSGYGESYSPSWNVLPYNGGGIGHYSGGSPNPSSNHGGGGTDLRLQDGGPDGSQNLGSRLIVAGGGGGNGNSGFGGGAVGGSHSSFGGTIDGQGGSQTAGGAGGSCESGKLWKGGSACINTYGGGGGGGYYGGGFSSYAGGGGSSFIYYDGITLQNNQGDSRCRGPGALYITALDEAPEIPDPTMPPTLVPSALPTLIPTLITDSAGTDTSSRMIFRSSGQMDTYVVPSGAHFIKVDACGAGGQNSLGGFISAVVPVTPRTTLYVYVGKRFGRSGGCSGSCGGATDIRTKPGNDPRLGGNPFSGLNFGEYNVESRLVVAGGGGGGQLGGHGGGKMAGPGRSPAGLNLNGYGGTQTAGGAAYRENAPTVNGISPAGQLWMGGTGDWLLGPGGGGYYGGGAGILSGGGGSSYVVPRGVILSNIRGDHRCDGDGIMYVTVVSELPPLNDDDEDDDLPPPEEGSAESNSNSNSSSLTNTGSTHFSCAAGTFRTSANACSACPSGTFRTASNSDLTCSPCPSGSHSAAFASACQMCPPGYASSFGRPCTICPSGTFSSSSGSPVCVPCELGLFSGPGATACANCAAAS